MFTYAITSMSQQPPKAQQANKNSWQKPSNMGSHIKRYIHTVYMHVTHSVHACNTSEHIVSKLFKTVVLLQTGQNIAPKSPKSKLKLKDIRQSYF